MYTIEAQVRYKFTLTLCDSFDSINEHVVTVRHSKMQR